MADKKEKIQREKKAIEKRKMVQRQALLLTGLARQTQILHNGVMHCVAAIQVLLEKGIITNEEINIKRKILENKSQDNQQNSNKSDSPISCLQSERTESSVSCVRLSGSELLGVEDKGISLGSKDA